MQIMPNGKVKNSEKEIKEAFSIADNSKEEIDLALDNSENLDDSFNMSEDSDIETEDIGKVKQVEDCLNDILGEPTLDGLMVVMTAIGASKISLNLSEDGDQLSFSGIISLTSEDKKIRKE